MNLKHGSSRIQRVRFSIQSSSAVGNTFSLEAPVPPSGLVQNDVTLEQLAKATQIIEQAGVAFDAPLGDVRFRAKLTRWFCFWGQTALGRSTQYRRWL